MHFFEFKQRTCHTHSFQLAQLIYHAQHINDYYTLPQNIGTQTNRRISVPSANDSINLSITTNYKQDITTKI
ncbi:unnamed protein product [Rotaria sordida]|uniref:Uncharacterized protein n=1 Tax=Rotaria sordida TaxID=392033 RepID=A0A814EGN7_9BILA|nr:unnamed protein product [Rotaria sordida]